MSDEESVVVDEDADLEPEETIQQLQEEIEELEDRLARALADKKNLAKRRDKDVDRAHTRAQRSVLRDVIPVLEDLQRALDGGVDEDGVALVYENLQDVLDRNGIERIDASGAFDPHLHDAVATVETDEVPDGEIVEEVQPGYRHDGDVIRPSKVTVARPPEEE